MTLERRFQPKVIKELKQRMPGCIVIKTDPTYLQGIPDLLVLHQGRFAALEVKNDPNARHRPNQDFYVKMMNQDGFASFIDPSNMDSVIDQTIAYFKES